MKKSTLSLMLSTVLAGAAVAAAGCSSSPGSNQGGSGGGSGGGGNSGNLTGVLITPDASGWVMGDTNTLGVQGAWYAYGDGIGADGSTATSTCVMKGGHQTSECSMITTPAAGPFTNTGGMMCTTGTVAKVINGANGMPDYSNIWGAGIGLDLNATGGLVSTKGVFDATAKGVKGISFDLSAVPLPGLRVEFATPSTNGSTAGNDYWGAAATYPNSPVKMGPNVVTWDLVKGPMGHAFTPGMIESIQFHVPTVVAATGTYNFCISNLKLLM